MLLVFISTLLQDSKKNSRKDLVGLNRAVEIVDQISDEALNGMTVLYTVEKIEPVADALEIGL